MKFITLSLAVFSAICLAEVSYSQGTGDLDPGFSFKSNSIKTEFLDTPKFDGFRGKTTQRKTKWLVVEAGFNWKASNKEDQEAGFIEELEAEFYVMLETNLSSEEQRVLLKGSTTLLHVGESGTGTINTAMFVSPRALERLFRGRPPTTTTGAVSAAGVVLKRGGKTVAFYSDYRNNQPFWENPEPTTKVVEGILLPKWKTPFAFSSWDYFEEEKQKD